MAVGAGDPVEISGPSLASGVQAASIDEVRISVIYSNLNMFYCFYCFYSLQPAVYRHMRYGC